MAEVPPTRKVLPDGTVSLKTADSEYFYKVLGSVVFTASAGVIQSQSAREVTAALDASREPVIIGHALFQTGYTTEARDLFSSWARGNGRRVRGVGLMRSKVVRMVASVVTMIARAEVSFCDSEEAFALATAKLLPPGVSNPHLETLLTMR